MSGADIWGWLVEALSIRFKWQAEEISLHVGFVWVGLLVWWMLR